MVGLVAGAGAARDAGDLLHVGAISGESMRLRRWVAACAVAAAAVAGCDAAPESAMIMPDVVDESLDVALSNITRARVDDEVEVVEGGVLAIVDESNWRVCEQLPTAGDAVTNVPRLTVDRDCEPQAEPAPSATSDGADSVADAEASGDATTREVLTTENSEDLAALLAGAGECGGLLRTSTADATSSSTATTPSWPLMMTTRRASTS